MLQLKTKMRRVAAIAASASLVLGVTAPALISNMASAGQVTSRFVEISTSAPSATGVEYTVGFTPATATTTSINSIVIDFCSNSPLIGDSCTATAGTNVPDFTGASASGGGSGNAGAWTTGTISGSQVKLNSTGGSAISTNVAQTIILTGVANPSATGSFYARITTYGNNSYGTYSAATTPGNYTDFGGVALSTATAINITAKVQETLTFCVSKVAPGTGCSGTSTPNLALGHGANTVLDNTAVDTDTAYFQVSTNASGDVIVRMKGNVLTSGTNTIPAANAGASTPGAISAGTAAFGMRIGTTSGTDYSASNITVDANYSHATNYAFDTTTAGNNTGTTYGDPIATVTASQDTFAKLTFGATASLTTPAGLYTATENLIATGTY